MRRLRLSIADPRAETVERAGVSWITSGLDRHAVDALRAGPAGAEPDLCRRCGDATIIKLERHGGGQRLTAWKGLTAGFDVFYRVDPAGDIVVSDHFRNVLSTLPVAERAPDDAVLCDHFLFRTLPGENTLSRSVKRLGRGASIVIDTATGRIRKSRFDAVEQIAEPGTLEQYLDRLDEALESVLGQLRGERGAAALFSGGVDSTLIQSYLDGTVPAVCYQLPWRAENFGTDYAGRAARLLGIEVEKHRVDLSDYLEKLESAIDTAGLPPPHLQLVLYQSLLGLGHERLIFGEQADALFGIELRRARLAAPFVSPAGRAALKLAARLMPSRARRITLIGDTAARLAEEPRAPTGYAGQFGTYTHRPLLEAVFGAELVRARLQARLDFALGMLPDTAATKSFYRHVDLAQMVDYLCEDIVSSFRHLAHARGRSMSSPFVTRRLLDTAQSIPVEQRYVRGLEVKHLLKSLLKRRVPAYPVKQRKGYTHMPFVHMYRGGALSGVWQRYEVPQLFEGEHRRQLVNIPTQMTWNAITLAMWQARVQKDPDLQPVPGSRTFDIPCGASGQAPQRV